MNNTEQLLNRFSNAIAWNGFFYLTHKLITTARSFILFYALSTQDFSLWANLNSTIFLILLWFDLGLRRTIPRYAPEFSQSFQIRTRFIATTIAIQLILLTIAAPLWYNAAAYRLHPPTTLLTLGLMLLITEGVIAILKLIFSSYFLHKQLNQLGAALVIATAIGQLGMVVGIPTSNRILIFLFTTQIAANIIFIILAGTILARLPAPTPEPTIKKSEPRTLIHQMITHAGCMWGTTLFKSLTERNVLVPLFTTLFGPEIANIFKVSQDGALLLHRLVIKTIGTTDTSLFTYAQMMNHEQDQVPQMFQKVITQIAALCIPLVGVLFLGIYWRALFFTSQFGFHIFYLLVTAYLVESILSPYERVLEVKQAYRSLFISYIPYGIMVLAMILSYQVMTSIGLLMSLIIIHVVRLVSLLYMARTVSEKYHVRISGSVLVLIGIVMVPLLCSVCIAYRE